MKRIILAALMLMSLILSLGVAPAITGTEHSDDVAKIVQSTLADSSFPGISFSDTCDYIGNSNTHKFHHPGCSWVPKIKPEHKVCFLNASIAIASGYDACKKCNPT